MLVGPTASGKTPLSLLLSDILRAEIISADSRQIYKLMDVGTAKPSQADLRRVTHHFISDRALTDPINAAEFGEMGRAVIADILRRGKLPLVVGGSGLYIKGLIDGFFDGAPPDPDVRQKLYERLDHEGPLRLLEELKGVDPEAASSMLPTNTRRIIRALEVYESTGKPISLLRKRKPEINFEPFIAGLEWPRDKLYQRINLRADEMIRNGLVEESRDLAKKYGEDLIPLQTVGYVEAFAFLRGEISHEKMASLVRQNSRRYAKRQLTWFRRDGRIRWFPVSGEEDFPEVAREIAGAFRGLK